MGDDHPVEVGASSSCDWPLLAILSARLRMTPGHALADLGCGSGGVGLWVARALAVHLVGVDISPAAVKLATARRTRFIPRGQADFRVGTLANTGLADQSVDGIICVDAAGCAPDRAATLREMQRILRPGARAVLTQALRHGARAPWTEQAEQAGLLVEAVDERPTEPLMWGRLYRLWITRETDLRRELGDQAADRMLAEARRKLPTLAGRRAVALTLRRPTDCPGRCLDAR
ncbi:class I SAM-dependent methyltransferase [Streptomyces sp. SID10853]|nr:class I SAM-dependent methyltransferase [Streptomyces sp. SID10853]